MASHSKENGGNEDVYGRYITFREKSHGSYARTIDYFLEKLKKVDDEITNVNCELQKVTEETTRKNSEISVLKTQLKKLLQQETVRKIDDLRLMKQSLKTRIEKADDILARLGLIWVGENPTVCQIPCKPQQDGGSHYREPHVDQRTSQGVTPFAGKGYRLGAASDLQISETSVKSPSSTKSAISENKTVSPASVRGVRGEMNLTAPSTKPSNSTEGAEVEGVKSFEKLPLELLVMSQGNRRRALKQTKVQIQKNMNKYCY